MELIDRAKVERITFQEPSYSDPINVLTEVRDKVRALPTVEAEPVRHGKWWRYPLEQLGFPEHVYMMRQCSECKKVFDQKWNYCPNCGAKMDKERKEE